MYVKSYCCGKENDKESAGINPPNKDNVAAAVKKLEKGFEYK